MTQPFCHVLPAVHVIPAVLHVLSPDLCLSLTILPAHYWARHSSTLDARLSVRGITSVTCSIALSAISFHFLYGSPFA